MLQASPPTSSDLLAFTKVERSLTRLAEEEAKRHKWIESEKAGRDLGEMAIRHWIRQHWNGFLRERWLEHLQGKTFWLELKETDFGLLEREFQDTPLLSPILDRLKTMKENLDIIGWALEEGLPMEDVRAILKSLDVNGCRLQCEFDTLMDRAVG